MKSSEVAAAFTSAFLPEDQGSIRSCMCPEPTRVWAPSLLRGLCRQLHILHVCAPSCFICGSTIYRQSHLLHVRASLIVRKGRMLLNKGVRNQHGRHHVPHCFMCVPVLLCTNTPCARVLKAGARLSNGLRPQQAPPLPLMPLMPRTYWFLAKTRSRSRTGDVHRLMKRLILLQAKKSNAFHPL